MYRDRGKCPDLKTQGNHFRATCIFSKQVTDPWFVAENILDILTQSQSSNQLKESKAQLII